MQKHSDQLKIQSLRVRIDREEKLNGTGRIQILPSDADEGSWSEHDRKSVAALWRLLLLCALVGGVLLFGALVWAFSLRG